MKIDGTVKSRIFLFCHSGLDPESSTFNMLWIPAFAGMTVSVLFTGSSRLNLSLNLNLRF